MARSKQTARKQGVGIPLRLLDPETRRKIERKISFFRAARQASNDNATRHESDSDSDMDSGKDGGNDSGKDGGNDSDTTVMTTTTTTNDESTPRTCNKKKTSDNNNNNKQLIATTNNDNNKEDQRLDPSKGPCDTNHDIDVDQASTTTLPWGWYARRRDQDGSDNSSNNSNKDPPFPRIGFSNVDQKPQEYPAPVLESPTQSLRLCQKVDDNNTTDSDTETLPLSKPPALAQIEKEVEKKENQLDLHVKPAARSQRFPQTARKCAGGKAPRKQFHRRLQHDDPAAQTMKKQLFNKKDNDKNENHKKDNDKTSQMQDAGEKERKETVIEILSDAEQNDENVRTTRKRQPRSALLRVTARARTRTNDQPRSVSHF